MTTSLVFAGQNMTSANV